MRDTLVGLPASVLQRARDASLIYMYGDSLSLDVYEHDRPTIVTARKCSLLTRFPSRSTNSNRRSVPVFEDEREIASETKRSRNDSSSEPEEIDFETLNLRIEITARRTIDHYSRKLPIGSGLRSTRSLKRCAHSTTIEVSVSRFVIGSNTVPRFFTRSLVDREKILPYPDAHARVLRFRSE